MKNGNSQSGLERTARIFNVQKYNTYDGPGVRTMIFLKGCPLRCKWCSNPEGLEKKYQVMYKRDLCVDCGKCVEVCPVGIHVMSQDDHQHKVLRHVDCIGCRACEKACIPKALSIAGEDKTMSELLEIIEEDAAFYQVSGGGVTLSGGEATMQTESALNILMVCKQHGINTAIETCGYVKPANLEKIAEYVDYFLFDMKHMDSDAHFKWTGVRNEMILDNIKYLMEKRKTVKIRMPLLKGVNDSKEEIEGIVKFLEPYKEYKNFEGIDLLPYHKMGVNKYKQLDMEYPIEGDPSLSDEELDVIEGWINKNNVKVCVIRH